MLDGLVSANNWKMISNALDGQLIAGTSAFELIHAPMTLPPCTYGPITMHL